MFGRLVHLFVLGLVEKPIEPAHPGPYTSSQHVGSCSTFGGMTASRRSGWGDGLQSC